MMSVEPSSPVESAEPQTLSPAWSSIRELMVCGVLLPADAGTDCASRSQLRMLAVQAGLVSLRADGWHKVEQGLTTVEEVARVVQD